MIFKFDKYGNLIESDTEDSLVQYSVNVNTLYAQFKDLDLTEYLPYISFERSDGQLSPYIAMAFAGNSVTYHFSDAWLTEKQGILKCAITLKQDGIVKKTATFNLNVYSSLNGRTITNVDDVALSELEVRTYALEQSVVELVENGAANIRIIEDTTSTRIELTPKNYYDYTYSSDDINAFILYLPEENIGHGFISGFNFKAKNNIVGVRMNKTSQLPVKFWINGRLADTYPQSIVNQSVNAVILCDGMTINIYMKVYE